MFAKVRRPVQWRCFASASRNGTGALYARGENEGRHMDSMEAFPFGRARYATGPRALREALFCRNACNAVCLADGKRAGPPARKAA
jgi:hypothetical protein